MNFNSAGGYSQIFIVESSCTVRERITFRRSIIAIVGLIFETDAPKSGALPEEPVFHRNQSMSQFMPIIRLEAFR
jgi:hypothetical protein